MRKYLLILFTASMALFFLSACAAGGECTPPAETYTVDLNPAEFVELVDNP
jgi:hypothetical protein